MRNRDQQRDASNVCDDLIHLAVGVRDTCVQLKSVEQNCDEFGFSAGAARVALNRLVARDLLEPSRKGRLVHYALTPRTVQILADGDHRIFTLGREARRPPKWTVLWHAIPEHRPLGGINRARKLVYRAISEFRHQMNHAPRVEPAPESAG